MRTNLGFVCFMNFVKRKMKIQRKMKLNNFKILSVFGSLKK